MSVSAILIPVHHIRLPAGVTLKRPNPAVGAQRAIDVGMAPSLLAAGAPAVLSQA